MKKVVIGISAIISVAAVALTVYAVHNSKKEGQSEKKCYMKEDVN
jgi:uncharacterized protein YxeA